MYCNCDQVDNLLTKAGGRLNTLYHGKYMLKVFECDFSCMSNHDSNKFFSQQLASICNLGESSQYQKQSPGGVLSKRCSQKSRKIHRKTPVLESLF